MSNGIKANTTPRTAIAVAVALTILYAARSVVTPILCALLAAFMVEPWVAAIERKTGRPIAVGSTLAILIIAAAAALIFFVPKAINEAIGAGAAVEQNISALNVLIQRWLTALPEDIKTQAADALSKYGGKVLAWAVGIIGGGFEFLRNVMSVLSKFVLFLFAFVFLMLDFPLLKPGFLNVISRIGAHAQVTKLDNFLSEAALLCRAFFRGQVVYAAVIGGLTAVGLWLIGLPYALLIGISVGVLSLIPYVGVGVGLLTAMALSFYTDGRIIHLLLTAGIFGAVQFVDAVYLTPKLLGGSVGIHPLLAVIALLAFSQLFGFFGLMLAIPLAAITLAAMRHLLVE